MTEELKTKFSAKTGLTFEEAEQFIVAFFDALREELATKGEIRLDDLVIKNTSSDKPATAVK